MNRMKNEVLHALLEDDEDDLNVKDFVGISDVELDRQKKELLPAAIKRKEQYLGARCGKTVQHVNPLGEVYVFGFFKSHDQHGDNLTTSTLLYLDPKRGWQMESELVVGQLLGIVEEVSSGIFMKQLDNGRQVFTCKCPVCGALHGGFRKYGDALANKKCTLCHRHEIEKLKKDVAKVDKPKKQKNIFQDRQNKPVVIGDALEQETEADRVLGPMKPEMVAAAQAVYDAWEQDAEGIDCELGAGGICQDIAEEIAGVLSTNGIDAGTVSAQSGDQHVWVMAKLSDGVYAVDIPPSVYETGGGYCWKKRPGVVFEPDHIFFDRVDPNPDTFENYLMDSLEDDELSVKELSTPPPERIAYEISDGSEYYPVTNYGKIGRQGWKVGQMSGDWNVRGYTSHHWSTHVMPWELMRRMLDNGETLAGYLWDVDHGSTRKWGRRVKVYKRNVNESEGEEEDIRSILGGDPNTPPGEVSKSVCVNAHRGTNFYHRTDRNSDGSPVRVRVNGRCKTWATRPNEFRLPVKFGLNQNLAITDGNAAEWSTVPPRVEPPAGLRSDSPGSWQAHQGWAGQV